MTASPDDGDLIREPDMPQRGSNGEYPPRPRMLAGSIKLKSVRA